MRWLYCGPVCSPHLTHLWHLPCKKSANSKQTQMTTFPRHAIHRERERRVSWAWSCFFLQQGKQMFSFFLCFLLLQLHRWINLKCCLLWGCSRCLQRRRFGQINNLSPNIAVPGCRVYIPWWMHPEGSFGAKSPNCNHRAVSHSQQEEWQVERSELLEAWAGDNSSRAYLNQSLVTLLTSGPHLRAESMTRPCTSLTTKVPCPQLSENSS